MSKPRESWREFEDVVAQIHRQVAAGATLLPNYIIRGQSGRDRQIDVAIEFTANTYPMLMVIECKKYSRRVGISEVEAFSRKLQDIKGGPRDRTLGILLRPAVPSNGRRVDPGGRIVFHPVDDRTGGTPIPR